jgi:hypothetical protein
MHVLPGAASPCGYPSSGFAARAGERNENARDEMRARVNTGLRFELMANRILKGLQKGSKRMISITQSNE